MTRGTRTCPAPTTRHGSSGTTEVFEWISEDYAGSLSDLTLRSAKVFSQLGQPNQPASKRELSRACVWLASV